MTPNITETVVALWPETMPASSAEKNSQITRVSQLLKTGAGDPLAGRLIFNSMCGRCHHLFEEGAILGPDLTGYDRKNINDLLTHIIDPGAYIREGYATYHITTTDGRSLLGAVRERNGSTIVIQPFSGGQITLSMDQIRDMEAQSISMMPERLLDGLSDQHIRDMVSYITKDL